MVLLETGIECDVPETDATTPAYDYWIRPRNVPGDREERSSLPQRFIRGSTGRTSLWSKVAPDNLVTFRFPLESEQSEATTGYNWSNDKYIARMAVKRYSEEAHADY